MEIILIHYCSPWQITKKKCIQYAKQLNFIVKINIPLQHSTVTCKKGLFLCILLLIVLHPRKLCTKFGKQKSSLELSSQETKEKQNMQTLDLTGLLSRWTLYLRFVVEKQLNEQFSVSDYYDGQNSTLSYEILSCSVWR